MFSVHQHYLAALLLLNFWPCYLKKPHSTCSTPVVSKPWVVRHWKQLQKQKVSLNLPSQTKRKNCSNAPTFAQWLGSYLVAFLDNWPTFWSAGLDSLLHCVLLPFILITHNPPHYHMQLNWGVGGGVVNVRARRKGFMRGGEQTKRGMTGTKKDVETSGEQE